MDKFAVAKELTLAAIEKMQFNRHGVNGTEHNRFVADEIAKVFSSIYDSVKSKE